MVCLPVGAFLSLQTDRKGTDSQVRKRRFEENPKKISPIRIEVSQEQQSAEGRRRRRRDGERVATEKEQEKGERERGGRRRRDKMEVGEEGGERSDRFRNKREERFPGRQRDQGIRNMQDAGATPTSHVHVPW